MSHVTVASLQLAFTDDMDADIAATAALVRQAAGQGAKIILPPELFQGHYFCRHERDVFFARAFPVTSHPAVTAMQQVALETKSYIPCSFFEADGPHHYNSLAMLDPGGNVMGIYRKSHIPDGPGYEEKFYFRPGNTGFKVWDTADGRIGGGICWDQWFPETARAMMLMGAELLFYPTAIGSEPQEPDLDTRRLWIRAMLGHAVSNVVAVVAANRTGTEEGQRFYGNSFIADQRGDMVVELGTDDSGVAIATLDLAEARANRASFGFFRDRRPDLYGRLSQDV